MIFKKLAVVLLALAFTDVVFARGNKDNLVVVDAAFAKDNLAVLPFTGGTGEEGEIIAELFSFSNELNAVFTPIPRTSITSAVNSEQRFQRNTGMTDPDTIVALGKQLRASYVLTGNIGKLGSQNLLTIAILKIDDLRQVAGDMQTYVDRRDIQGKLPGMAQNIIKAMKIDASRLEKLAITPVQLGADTDAQVADMLAQILSINLIKSGKYAVYPRTATLEQAKAEYTNQRSGLTADENIVDIGKGENPRLALSVVARRWDNQNMFNAAIINLESGAQVIGESVDYQTLDDGISVMESLARKLTTTFLSVSLAESLKWISKNATDGGNYTIILKNNETIAPKTLSYNGKKVNITLDGGSAGWTVSLRSNGRLFTVGSGVTLMLGNNVSLRGRSRNTSPLVQVNSEGTLVMESGTISGNSAKEGGGVYVSGTFTMSGGTINGNSGGGVSVSGGTFTQSGGTISGNSGGGVSVSGGTFTQSGGTISGNSTTGYGSGGGVSMYSGTFTQSGGTISGNSADRDGGGVFVLSNGTFTQSDGTISGNSADWGGGGVDVSGGTFTQSGGTISGNSASGSGGGVSVSSRGTFTQSGGAINGNSTSRSGGGVDVSGGTFTQSGGTISGNSASDEGGGVSVYGTFTKQAGGVIYGSDASGTLKNTTTSGNGHAVYVYSGSKKRNSTAYVGVTLDSGSAGGWE
ncbi:MAG: penicillin-binding protein activator LpoB [Treponema sp.]|nr:penicillin-binding protein activator LpoB [Treponema sp.]